ncbi:MAG: NADPH-dependent glutamate synthase [Actinomycetota bacterium]|nr:NADPH-dependent glutamate synthase [Actinomycetota bacterium]
MVLKRVQMPERAPGVRVTNFNEVALGYSPERAIQEASRCLQCKDSPCRRGCPVEVDIPAFVKCIKEGDFTGAIREIKKKNFLPAICGRVCPQENQCERFCVLGKKRDPLTIGGLERFAADHGRDKNPLDEPSKPKPTVKRVAVVGSGPAGLTVAGDLARVGHEVTLFEGLHKPGGVLVYGIPEFRLPKEIVEFEVDYVRQLGVEIKTNAVIGKLFTIDELFKRGYHAIFIGVGAGLPLFMGIPGENLDGVYSANEFLTRANLMKSYLFPEYDTPIKRGGRVAVVGGGNVAVDAARVALRLGADEVYLVYRRGEAEMPARAEEIRHAKEEGIIFEVLTLPVRLLGKNGWVCGMECVRVELGEPDESGRRRPIPIKGSEFALDVDVVVVAIGTRANPLLPSTTPGLELNERGYIVADEETGRTSREGVFAGGDIVTGAATVISAMGAGRKAARAIDEYLKK